MLLDVLLSFVIASSVELTKSKEETAETFFTALDGAYFYRLFPNGQLNIYENPINNIDQIYSTKPISFSWDSLTIVHSLIIDPPDFPIVYIGLEALGSKLYFFGTYKHQGTIIQKTFFPNGQLSPIEWEESLTTNIKRACINEEKLYIEGSDGIIQYPLLQDGTFDINQGSMVLPTYRMHGAHPYRDYPFTVCKDTLYITLKNQIFFYKIKNMEKSRLDVCAQEFIRLPEELSNSSPSQLFFWKEKLFVTYPKKVASIDFSKPQIDFQTIEFNSKNLFACHNNDVLCIASSKQLDFYFNTLSFNLKNEPKNAQTEENTFLKRILDFFCFYGKRGNKLEEVEDVEKYYEL